MKLRFLILALCFFSIASAFGQKQYPFRTADNDSIGYSDESAFAPDWLTWKVGGNTVSAHSVFGTNSAHDLIFRTNSTERMRIFAAGKVAIGTNSTSQNPYLDIVTGVGNGTINESAGIRLRHSTTNGNTFVMQLGTSNVSKGGGNQGYGYIQTGLWGGSANNPLILQPQAGQVSIGDVEALSDWNFAVKTKIAVRGPTLSGNNTTMGKLIFAHASSYINESVYLCGVYDKSAFYQGAGLAFYTQAGGDITGGLPSEKMRISSDGYVGINTNNPLTPLHVNGVARFTLASGASTDSIVTANASGDLQKRTVASVLSSVAIPTLSSVLASGNSAGSAHIDMNVVKGIGYSASTTFSRYSENILRHGLTFATKADAYSAGNYTTTLSGHGGINFAASDSVYMRLRYDGNFGIGTQNPSEKLEIAGGKIKTPAIQITTGAAAGYLLQSDAGGNASWSNALSNVVDTVNRYNGNGLFSFRNAETAQRDSASTQITYTKIGDSKTEKPYWQGELRKKLTQYGYNSAGYISANYTISPYVNIDPLLLNYSAGATFATVTDSNSIDGYAITGVTGDSLFIAQNYDKPQMWHSRLVVFYLKDVSSGNFKWNVQNVIAGMTQSGTVNTSGSANTLGILTIDNIVPPAFGEQIRTNIQVTSGTVKILGFFAVNPSQKGLIINKIGHSAWTTNDFNNVLSKVPAQTILKTIHSNGLIDVALGANDVVTYNQSVFNTKMRTLVTQINAQVNQSILLSCSADMSGRLQDSVEKTLFRISKDYTNTNFLSYRPTYENKYNSLFFTDGVHENTKGWKLNSEVLSNFLQSTYAKNDFSYLNFKSDTTQEFGVKMLLNNNTFDNRQLVVADNYTGLGLRLIGNSIAGYNYKTDDIQPTNVGVSGYTTTVNGNVSVPASLSIGGSLSVKVQTYTTSSNSITLGINDHTIFITGSTTGNSITLPSASTCVGREYMISNPSSGVVTISTFKSFNGGSVAALAPSEAYKIISDGTDWRQTY